MAHSYCPTHHCYFETNDGEPPCCIAAEGEAELAEILAGRPLVLTGPRFNPTVDTLDD